MCEALRPALPRSHVPRGAALRSWTCCGAADGTEPGPLSQDLHKQAWNEGNGCLWDCFNMKDHLPEQGCVPADFRLLLARFCGNVSKVSSVQMTAAERLSFGGTLLNCTLCPVFLHHLFKFKLVIATGGASLAGTGLTPMFVFALQKFPFE